ncbi:hypothetical protein SAY87_021069 [Trapa incisa]|uniref:Uncharacterized protein n=1 Tax=Trapa incisa TaxID=236973 RepID=A0AAN7JR92_9MYRT|nr:hypothetical protein SAY87_021069 [Trapa incisa]
MHLSLLLSTEFPIWSGSGQPLHQFDFGVYIHLAKLIIFVFILMPSFCPFPSFIPYQLDRYAEGSILWHGHHLILFLTFTVWLRLGLDKALLWVHCSNAYFLLGDSSLTFL